MKVYEWHGCKRAQNLRLRKRARVLSYVWSSSRRSLAGTAGAHGPLRVCLSSHPVSFAPGSSACPGVWAASEAVHENLLRAQADRLRALKG